MRNESLSYRETARRFDVPRDRLPAWERVYLEEGPEGLTIERRGCSSKGHPRKLRTAVEEELIAEVQRLRVEVDYLRNLQALVWEDERRQRKERR